MFTGGSSKAKEYWGYLSARLMVENSLDHNIRRKFTINKNETLEFVFMNPTRATKDKYILSLTMLSDRGDNFTANIEIYERYHFDKNNQTSYKKILQQSTDGEFFSKNNYSLTSTSGPNLITTLEVKKRLSLEEKKAIFDEMKANKTEK